MFSLFSLLLYVFIDVRFSHLNKDYLLTYLLNTLLLETGVCCRCRSCVQASTNDSAVLRRIRSKLMSCVRHPSYIIIIIIVIVVIVIIISRSSSSSGQTSSVALIINAVMMIVRCMLLIGRF